MESALSAATKLASNEMSGSTAPTKEAKSYHTKATGAAATTAEEHSNEHELKLYGSCFWYGELNSQSDENYLLSFPKSLRAASMDFSGVQEPALPIH